MFAIFLLSLFALVMLVSLVAGIVLKNDEQRREYPKTGAFIVLGISTFLFILTWLAFSITSVGTRHVGVTTAFGKPTGHLSNGLHMVWPWEDVTELDNTIQTDTYASESYDGKTQGGATESCVHVRIARQATACLNISVRWQTNQDKVDYLFRNFKNDGSITDNLVLRDLQEAVNQAFIDYDPLGIDEKGNSTNKTLTVLAREVLAKMQADVREQNEDSIHIYNVLIPILHFDPDTQKRINEVQQQIAATRVAIQQRQTSIEQAKANEALAASVSKDPNVLIAQCLQMSKEAKPGQLPAGWNCFGGSTVGITVPAK